MVKKKKTGINKSKTVAYLRVSTIDQDIEKNRAEILKLGNDKNLGKIHFIEEKVSGKIPFRFFKIDELEKIIENEKFLTLEKEIIYTRGQPGYFNISKKI